MSEIRNGKYVSENGEIRWYKSNTLHRIDGPAIEYPDGSTAWFCNGVRHRAGGPAYLGADGTAQWWTKGVKVESSTKKELLFLLNLEGLKILREYLLDGVRHNEQGHAVMYFNGVRAWYLNGILDREDGPALQFPDGQGLWFRKGLPHREDGPAITYLDGRQEWYVDGYEYTKEEFEQYIARKQLKDALQSDLHVGGSKSVKIKV